MDGFQVDDENPYAQRGVALVGARHDETEDRIAGRVSRPDAGISERSDQPRIDGRHERRSCRRECRRWRERTDGLRR